MKNKPTEQTGIKAFIEQQVVQMKLRNGDTIYCDSDGRWFLWGEPAFYDSLKELLSDCFQVDVDIDSEVFEAIIAPIGAGVEVKPSMENEGLAMRYYRTTIQEKDQWENFKR